VEPDAKPDMKPGAKPDLYLDWELERAPGCGLDADVWQEGWAVAPARLALAETVGSRAHGQKGSDLLCLRRRLVCCLQSRSFEPLNPYLLIKAQNSQRGKLAFNFGHGGAGCIFPGFDTSDTIARFA